MNVLRVRQGGKGNEKYWRIHVGFPWVCWLFRETEMLVQAKGSEPETPRISRRNILILMIFNKFIYPQTPMRSDSSISPARGLERKRVWEVGDLESPLGHPEWGAAPLFPILSRLWSFLILHFLDLTRILPPEEAEVRREFTYVGRGREAVVSPCSNRKLS